uniref:Uncharacterized protein n=1 Tax=Oryza barthii TaxID=65489 RepID=A0A0D3H3G9_9ORYZ
MQCILHWNYVQNMKRILHTQVSTELVTKQVPDVYLGLRRRLHVLADLLYVLRLLRNFRGGLDGFLLLIISSAASSTSGAYPSSWSDSSGTSDSSAALGSAKSSAAADDEEDWKESDAASCACERQRVERMWRRGVDGERRRRGRA